VARLSALRDLLRTRDFRQLYSTRLVGQFGDGLLQSALATFVLFSPERQPDAFKVAAAFAILLLPYSLVGPFAGVLLDRWRRRQVLVGANALKALLVLPILLLVIAGDDGVGLGVSVLIVLAVGRFILAGLSASLPHVVSGPNLITANALTPTSGTIAAAVGAGVGVVVRGLAGGGDVGSAVVLVAAAVAFACAGLVALTIGRDRLGPDGERVGDTPKAIVLGLVDGLRVLRKQPRAARAIGLVGANRIAFGVLTAGGLLLVRVTFHSPDEADAALAKFAILTGAAATGALLGALTTPAASRRWGEVRWSAAAVAQAAVLGIGVVIAGAMVPSFPLLLVGAVSIGFAGQTAKVCADTLVQRHIPDDHLGRVFALFDMFVNVCLVSGVVVMAVVSPTSGQAPALYAVIGLLLLATTGWYLRAAPRRVRSDSQRGHGTRNR